MNDNLQRIQNHILRNFVALYGSTASEVAGTILFVRSLIGNDKWKLDAAQEIKPTGKQSAGDRRWKTCVNM